MASIGSQSPKSRTLQYQVVWSFWRRYVSEAWRFLKSTPRPMFSLFYSTGLCESRSQLLLSTMDSAILPEMIIMVSVSKIVIKSLTQCFPLQDLLWLWVPLHSKRTITKKPTYSLFFIKKISYAVMFYFIILLDCLYILHIPHTFMNVHDLLWFLSYLCVR